MNCIAITGLSGLSCHLCRADCLRDRSGGFRVGIQIFGYPQNQEILETTAVIPDRERWTESLDDSRENADSDTNNDSVKSLFHSRFQKVEP